VLSIGINGNQDTRVAGSRCPNPVPQCRAFAAITWMCNERGPRPESRVPRPIR